MKKIPKQGLTGEVLLREATTEFRAIIELLRGALMKKLYPLSNDMWLVDIVAIYPDRVITAKDGKQYQFPYTLAEDNQITLGDPVEVQENFVPIKEAAINTGAFLEAQGDQDSGKWLIRIIQAGISFNNNFYADAVLREAAPMFNGVRVFVKSDAEHIKGEGKAFNQLVGGLSDAKFVEGSGADNGEITAIFTLIEPEGTTAVKVREAYGRGLANLFGFSIDANASAKTVMRESKKVRMATKITKVHSVDLIVEPGAGGQLIRMVEAINHKEQDTMRTRMLEAVQKKDPKKFAGIKIEDIDDDELEQAYREAISDKDKPGNTDDVREQIRMIEARANMRVEIGKSTLPAAAQDKLIADFNVRESFQDADVTKAITDEREYLSKFTESGKPVIHFDEAGRTGDRSVVIADMLDAFFDPAHKDHQTVASFKECYIQITGDKRVTGRLENVDKSRLREALGGDFRESLDSSTFAEVLGNSITRRLQAIYTGMTDLQSWRKVATVGRVNDFRTQEVGRIGGYGNLPIVGEGDPYGPMNSPGDDHVSFAVSKRGGTEDVTLEMIKNDDMRVLSRIPQELALAAANTLYEFVYDFFRTNPVGWDGLAIYHASHNNLFTAALSATEFATHRLSMQKQTRAGSAKRLATGPGVVLVPFDLAETAYNLFIRNQNLDKTFIQSINPEVITVDYWTDATDWVTVASKDRLPVLEIDFLDGKEDPELFVQDMPNVGSMFSNDKLTYKLRHIYGGNFLVDAEKGTTKAVVAG